MIRLRGPWTCRPLAQFVREVDGAYRAETQDLPPAGKTTVPGDWGQVLGPDFRGTVRYTRRFNRPTNLGPRERVWLALDAVDYRAEVTLNGQPVGFVPGFDGMRRFDITASLEPHNELTVDVTLPAEVFRDSQARPNRAAAPGGIIGEVRLEIVSHTETRPGFY